MMKTKYRVREHLKEFIIEVAEEIEIPKYALLPFLTKKEIYWRRANKNGQPVRFMNMQSFSRLYNSIQDSFDSLDGAKNKIMQWETPDKFHYL